MERGGVPPEIVDITSRFHFAKGGIPALGTFAHGSYSTILKIAPGGQTYPDLSMVQKRATNTLKAIDEIEQMLVHPASNRTYHAAFIILQRSVSHAFDYDARLVGAAALQSVTTPAVDRMLEAIGHLMGQWDDHAKAQVTLIGQFGGCFLRCVIRDGYAQAAMWAAHVTNLKMRKCIAAQLDCPPPFASEELVEAGHALKAWGIEVWNQGLAVTPDFKAFYDSTPWVEDFTVEDLVDRITRQQDGRPTGMAGALFRILDAARAAHLWKNAGVQRKAHFLSSGGPGTGTFWIQRRLGKRGMFPNSHFREALKLKLGCTSAPPGCICNIQRGADKIEKVPCGAALESVGILVHPHLCSFSGAYLRPHRGLCKGVGRILAASGGILDYERYVPELYQIRNRKGDETIIPENLTQADIRGAQMDIYALWPGDSQQLLVDIGTTCPLQPSGVDMHLHPGKAAKERDGDKDSRYLDGVHKLMFETYGRCGSQSIATLKLMAQKACEHGAYAGPPARLEADLRQEAERILFFTNADNVLLALGADLKRAGGNAYPIGKLVRPRRSGAGETRERTVTGAAPEVLDTPSYHPAQGNAIRLVQADSYHPFDPLPPNERTEPLGERKPWNDIRQLEHAPAFLSQGGSQQMMDITEAGVKSSASHYQDPDYDPDFA